jgi:hypothetical protein
MENIGQNLSSLQIGLVNNKEVLPKEVLELCPRLERLDTTLCLRHPPPSDHPLYTVGLRLPFYDYENFWIDVIVSPFPPDIDGWESMGKFIVDVDWRKLKDSDAPFLQLVKDWGLVCQQHGVALEDPCGVSLEDSGKI